MENHTNPTYNKRMHQTTDAKLEPLMPYLKPNTTFTWLWLRLQSRLHHVYWRYRAIYYGYDISPIVNQQFKENKVKHLSKDDLEAQTETFDVIYLSSVLHEFFSYLSPKDYRDTMATIVKALKPDGYLILRDWPIIQEPNKIQNSSLKTKKPLKSLTIGETPSKTMRLQALLKKATQRPIMAKKLTSLNSSSMSHGVLNR